MFSIVVEVRESDRETKTGLTAVDFLRRFELPLRAGALNVGRQIDFSAGGRAEERCTAEVDEAFARAWFLDRDASRQWQKISVDWLVAGELVDHWEPDSPRDRCLILNLTPERVRELFIRARFEGLRNTAKRLRAKLREHQPA